MNRLGKMTCLACVCLAATFLTSAWADEPPVPVCELGLQLRDALGFGPVVLAALGVDEQTHNAIAAAADTYCQQNRETVEPLLTAVYGARYDAFCQYELGEDVLTTDQALDDAIAALASPCGETAATLDSLLTTEQQVMRAHVAANRMLEPPLCLLALSDQQRSDLLAAQRTRDLVMRHYRDRTNLALVKAAHDAFQISVTAILTSDQMAEYESLLGNLHEHFGEFQAREEARCVD